MQQRQGVHVGLLLFHQRAGESCKTSAVSLNSGYIVSFDYCGLIFFFSKDLCSFSVHIKQRDIVFLYCITVLKLYFKDK